MQYFLFADYRGVKIPAVVGIENTIGLQFHPEKSGEAGLSFLEFWGRN